MVQDITLEIVDDKVKVVTPYHEAFVKKCRNFRGSFKNGAWWFDDSIVDYVREEMLKHFGTTGETPYENCILKITDYSDSEMNGPVTLFGRTIARANGRDSEARLGDGIIFLEGTFRAGGSVRNWKTEVSHATFEMHNFPMPATHLPEVSKAIEEGWCQIKPCKKIRDPEEILKEIETLQERIEQLQKEYNSYDV